MKLNLTEAWCMNAAAREGDSEIGAGLLARDPKPHDFSRFDNLLVDLVGWRDADHADNISLCRGQIIEIIEGVKALRGS